MTEDIAKVLLTEEEIQARVKVAGDWPANAH